MIDRPTCHCGKWARNKGRKPNGDRRWGNQCSSCYARKRSPASRKRSNRKKEIKRRPWLVWRKDNCERCGFIPVDACQLDVDHIDGDNSNNDPANYMTLCANCHRLKTQMCRDWLTPSDQRHLRDAWKQGDLFN